MGLVTSLKVPAKNSDLKVFILAVIKIRGYVEHIDGRLAMIAHDHTYTKVFIANCKSQDRQE